MNQHWQPKKEQKLRYGILPCSCRWIATVKPMTGNGGGGDGDDGDDDDDDDDTARWLWLWK